MVNNIQSILNEWKHWIGSNSVNTDRITQQALEILQSIPASEEAIPDLDEITATLDKFEFTSDQREKIYQLLSGVDENSPLFKNLVRKQAAFHDFSETLTIHFGDKEIKIPKAEFCAYGDYFASLASGVFSDERNNEIQMQGIAIEDFEVIRNVMRDGAMIEGEPEVLIEWLRLGDAFLIPEIKDAIPTFGTLDQAIELARTYNLHKMDLTRCSGVLTKEHLQQIHAIGSIQRVNGVLDLNALFPELRIIDEATWSARVDMPKFGLSMSDAPPLDIDKVILTLHQMYQMVKVEDNKGFTLLRLPKGLTLNKLILIAKDAFTFLNDEATDDFFGLYGDVEETQVSTIAITNSVLVRSIHAYDKGMFIYRNGGCNLPRLIEALTLCLFSGEWVPTEVREILGCDHCDILGKDQLSIQRRFQVELGDILSTFHHFKVPVGALGIKNL